jgi:DedD protein
MRLVRQHQRNRQKGSGSRWLFLLGGIFIFAVGAWIIPQILDRPSESNASSASKKAPAPSGTVPNPSDRADAESFTFYKTLKAPPNARSEPPGLVPKSSVILPGQAVEPAPESSAAPSAHVQKTRSKAYDIQVAAFRERSAAINLIHHLKKKKYPVYLLTVGVRGQETWYRVRVGPFATRPQAEDVARRLKAKERLGSYIAHSTGTR